MPQAAKATELLSIPPEEFPQAAVNAMSVLQYRSEMFDEAYQRLVFFDDAVESYGMETWRCRYQVILSWTDKGDGVEIEIRVKEKNYGDTHIESCIERAQVIVEELLRTAEKVQQKKKVEVPWRAKFAGEPELEDGGFVLEPGGPAAAISQSLLVGKFEDKKLWLTRDVKVRHTLVCGPTGCGKSSSIFIPNLIERLESSAIVTEASPGSKLPVLYGATAGWRAKAGQKIIYFNPDDSRTNRLNPVDLVQSFDDAQMIAGLIVSNTTAESHMGDQIWGQAETHLLQALLLHAAGLRSHMKKPSVKGDNANLSYIRTLLRKGPKGMEEELRTTRLPMARAEYEAFLNNSSPNFRFGVVSGLLARLALFANPKIAAATEVTDFSTDELTQQRFTMYMAVPVHRPDYLPLSALAFNFIFTFVMSKLDDLKHPLTLYLDEFTNYGAIPGIGRYLTVIRNAGIGAVLGIQDLAQLEYVYKDKLAQIIWSQPRTKILFPPADDRMAERISRMLGNETQQEIVGANGHLSNRRFPRPLIDVTDLMEMEKAGEYLVVSSTNPVRASRMKSWSDYPSTTRLPIPVIPELVVEDLEEVINEQSAKAYTATEPGPEAAQPEMGRSEFAHKVTGDQPIVSNNESEDLIGRENEETNTGENEHHGDDGPETDFWSNLRDSYK